MSAVQSIHWPDMNLRSINLMTLTDNLVNKAPAFFIAGDQNDLFISYDTFNEATNKSSARLVRCLLDGSEEKQIDTGLISNLVLCDRYLLYRKDIDNFHR
jgi:hypothetical protein